MLYFLILLAAFNLLFAAAYPFYSGVALFGDWASVIAGLAPAWLWRALLIVGSVSLYWLFLSWLAVAIRSFCGVSDRASLDRLHHITLISFLSALVIACIAGVFNPQGWINILSPRPASFGITQLDHFRAALTSDPPHRLPGPFPAARHGSSQPPSRPSCLSHFSVPASAFTEVKVGRWGVPLRPAVHRTHTDLLNELRGQVINHSERRKFNRSCSSDLDSALNLETTELASEAQT